MHSYPRHLTPVVAAVLIGLLAPFCLRAEETAAPAPQTGRSGASGNAAVERRQIERWIAELSHDAFAVRQSAAERLLAAGMSARGPLQAIVEGPDPEARAAARRLVALIDQSDFHRRLDAFAADTDGRRGLSLPGWEEFRASVGGDANARALFVEIQRHEGPLMSAAFGDNPQPPEQLWEDRMLRLVKWPAAGVDRSAAPPLGSCAALLFLGTAVEMTVSDHGAMLVENMIQRPPIREAIAAADRQDAVRRLVTGWILNCPNENEHILARRLNLASTIDLEEVLPLALAVAGNDPQYASVRPTTRAQAILLVGQFGTRENVRHLEPLLEDATVCMPLQAQQLPGQPVVNVQVRDVALVVMLHLTGQRPADYGYVHARLQPQRTFQLPTLHRENDEQRAEAIAKWRSRRFTERRGNGKGDTPNAKEREKVREEQRADVEIVVPGFVPLDK